MEALDPAATLSAKLQLLDLSVEELQVLDRVLAHAATYDAPAELLVAPESLVAAPVQRGVISRTAHALRCTHVRAAAAFADALELLVASSRRYGVSLSPSAEVDEAWHQFILFTADYQQYCEKIAGRYLHHWPTIPGRTSGGRTLGPEETFAHLVERGHRLHAELWTGPPLGEALRRLGH